MKIKEYYASKNKKIKLCIENFKTILAFEIFYKLLGLFILLPIVKEIFKFTLRITGLKIIIQNNILEYISKPVIYPFLLLIVMIAGVYVYFEIISFVNITLYIMKNRCISLFELLEVNIKTLKQQVKPINIFLWVYILLLLPLSFSFLENYLIVNFAFPSFVLDYFQYNLHLFFFVLVFLLICFWFTWIWCFVFHFMILKDMNFLEARKASSFLWKKNKGKFFKKSFLVFLISFISKYTIGVWQYACGYIVYKMRADANLLTLYLITLVYIFINLCIKIALNIFVFYELSDFYYEYNPVQKMPKKLKNNKLKALKINLGLNIAMIAIFIFTTWGSLKLKERITDLDKWGNTKITAHRGDSIKEIENTLEAFKSAIKSECDYIELDVMLTKDEKLVITHDSNLKRLTGVNRRVKELTLAEIKELDIVRNGKKAKFATLDETLDFTSGKIKLNIELKPDGDDELLAQRVYEKLRDYDRKDFIISSFSKRALKKMKELDPGIKTGITMAISIGDKGAFENVDFYSLEESYVTRKDIENAHKNNREVHVWMINSESELVYVMHKGVDNVITDYPEIMVKKRDKVLENKRKYIISYMFQFEISGI